MFKIFIGCDHAGVELKEALKGHLQQRFPDWTIVDKGTHTGESVHYPNFAKEVCREVLHNDGARGLLICGTGIGMSIVANRFKGIRAALCYRPQEAALSREHNNSNVLCLGARVASLEVNQQTLQSWMSTPFGSGRHEDRLKMFEDLGEVL